VYISEPYESWFSNYEFKLLADTEGEGCTLIICDELLHPELQINSTIADKMAPKK